MAVALLLPGLISCTTKKLRSKSTFKQTKAAETLADRGIVHNERQLELLVELLDGRNNRPRAAALHALQAGAMRKTEQPAWDAVQASPILCPRAMQALRDRWMSFPFAERGEALGLLAEASCDRDEEWLWQRLAASGFDPRHVIPLRPWLAERLDAEPDRFWAVASSPSPQPETVAALLSVALDDHLDTEELGHVVGALNKPVWRVLPDERRDQLEALFSADEAMAVPDLQMKVVRTQCLPTPLRQGAWAALQPTGSATAPFTQRLETIRLLTSEPGTLAVSVLAEALRHGQPEEIEAACLGAAEGHTGGFDAQLSEALQHPDHYVRQACGQAAEAMKSSSTDGKRHAP
jgi:hypothetical protein